MSYGLSTLSQSWVQEAKNLMIFEKSPPEHMLLAYREPLANFRRFTLWAQTYKKAEYRRVVVHPGMAIGKP